MKPFMITAALLAAPLLAQDADRDGLQDLREQQLLQQFRPRFLVAHGECGVLPATFAAGATPRVVSRDGRIYGQAFPASPTGLAGDFVELHFYHLWGRDCGLRGHPLDVEHVSALIDTSGAKARALYWFASAHQGTLCDSSHVVPAKLLKADDTGPPVWISEGKHASFLSEEECARGCGSDRCSSGTSLAEGGVVNVGELEAPMNGAEWVRAREWDFSSKMTTDFTPPVLAAARSANGLVTVNAPRRGVRTTLKVASKPEQALSNGRDHTGSALATADGKVRRSLKRAHRKVLGWFGK